MHRDEIAIFIAIFDVSEPFQPQFSFNECSEIIVVNVARHKEHIDAVVAVQLDLDGG